MYRSKAWKINKKTANTINAAEMWFIRRRMRIWYTNRMTNVEVLKRANTNRSRCRNIGEKQARFFGHIMRRGGLECDVTCEKIQGKRRRGRRREPIKIPNLVTKRYCLFGR